MGDDGVGLAVMARLGERWELPEDVALVDGGTWGMHLLPEIEAGDCCSSSTRSTPAARRARSPWWSGRSFPATSSDKLSPHQVDLREVLAICELRGTLPR